MELLTEIHPLVVQIQYLDDEISVVGIQGMITPQDAVQMEADAQSMSLEKEGDYLFSVNYNPPKFIDGGLTDGEWWDFTEMHYESFPKPTEECETIPCWNI